MNGGIARLPFGEDHGIPGFPLPAGQVYGCMGEAMLLGLEGVRDATFTGMLPAENVYRLKSMAERHGFKLAEVQDAIDNRRSAWRVNRPQRVTQPSSWITGQAIFALVRVHLSWATRYSSASTSDARAAVSAGQIDARNAAAKMIGATTSVTRSGTRSAAHAGHIAPDDLQNVIQIDRAYCVAQHQTQRSGAERLDPDRPPDLAVPPADSPQDPEFPPTIGDRDDQRVDDPEHTDQDRHRDLNVGQTEPLSREAENVARGGRCCSERTPDAVRRSGRESSVSRRLYRRCGSEIDPEQVHRVVAPVART